MKPASNCFNCLRPCHRPAFSLQMRQTIHSCNLCSSLLMRSSSTSIVVSLRYFDGHNIRAKLVQDNKIFIQGVFKSRKRFEALRSFTLESGQLEIERLKQRSKEAAEVSHPPASPTRTSRNSSVDSIRSPLSARTPTLSNVPEEGGAFAIGDDDESEDEEQEVLRTPSQSSPSAHTSRNASISSSNGEPLPTQLRGMSEKARGKMPAGQPSFSRQNSTTSLNNHAATISSPTSGFEPTAYWDRFMAPYPTIAHRSNTSLISLAAQTITARFRPKPTTDPSLRMDVTFPRLVRVPTLGLHLCLRNGRPERYCRRMEWDGRTAFQSGDRGSYRTKSYEGTCKSFRFPLFIPYKILQDLFWEQGRLCAPGCVFETMFLPEMC